MCRPGAPPASRRSHSAATTSAPKALMPAASSPKAISRMRIQRGTSAPQASEKRSSWLELVIGMMPGTTGTPMPSARTSSR